MWISFLLDELFLGIAYASSCVPEIIDTIVDMHLFWAFLEYE